MKIPTITYPRMPKLSFRAPTAPQNPLLSVRLSWSPIRFRVYKPPTITAMTTDTAVMVRL
jgi:hypothetical protein